MAAGNRAAATPADAPPEPRFGGRETLAVFALGLLARLGYLLEMRGHELLAQPLGDAAAFDAWARRIAGGDGLGAGPFYQAPLYPYLLGAVYALAGGEALVARLLQATLGAATGALVARATAGSFARDGAPARLAGWLAGAGLALYAPAIYYDGLLEKTNLACLLLAGVLVLAVPRRRPVPGSRALCLGAIVGALALTRENLAVVGLPLLVWLAAGRDAAAVRRALAFLAGLVLVLFPVAARNAAVGLGFGLGASNLGPNLFIGNHAGADGLYAPLIRGRGTARFEQQDAREIARRATGRELSAPQVSRYWTARATAWMRAQPGAALALTLRKARYLASDREWMDSRSYLAHARESRVLSGLGKLLRFGTLLPLALLGLAAAWPDRRRLALPLVLVPTIAASILPFFVFGRFRMGLAIALTPFAAHGAAEVVRRLRARDRRGRTPAGLLALAGVVLAWWPVPAGLEYPMADTYNNLGSAQLEAGRTTAAERSFERAIAAQPDYAAPSFNLGLALAARGELEAATPHLARAARLEPGYGVEAELTLAEGHLRRGDAANARARLARARQLGPASPEDFLRIGLLARHLGDAALAEASYRRALALRPEYPEVHNNLGFLLEGSGRLEEAADHYASAVALDPGYVRALVNLAWLRLNASDASLRDPAAALDLATRVHALLGPDDPAAVRLLAAARAARRAPEGAGER